ncbi:MAG: bifunctional folylpolyglutamate synthase/dihydrofolate synthase, partial [Leuconostoc falkenbergense]
MDKQLEKRETKILARYKRVIKSFDKTWRVIDDTRVPILREVLSWLDHPDTKLKIIQIAGTNGKGSTGAMLGAVLK